MAKRSQKEGEDEVGEEPRTVRKAMSNEGDGDGERRKERTGDAVMTPVRCWAHGMNAVRKATARLFRREARGIQSF